MVRTAGPHLNFLLLANTLSIAGAIWLAGCDRTEEFAQTKGVRAGQFASADRSAADLLERSAAAYARLNSYSDSGRVVLTYKVENETAQDVAPLAVAFERPNRLGVRAYQVTAGVTENRFRMRLTSDKVSPLRTQVVSRSLPERLDLNWLMLDSMASEHLAAGLAGAPPQLEFLLSDQPFRSLLDASAVVTFDGEGTEAGKSFHIVKIMRGQAKVRLWIDAQTSLLRRIELPTASLPTEMLADARISDIHLSIELDNIVTGGKVNWSEWQVPLVALDQLVRYFVAPPAIALDPRLGKSIPAFRMQAVADGTSLDTSQKAASGQIQLLVWLADHPACRTTIEQISQALTQLPETIRQQISPVAVWAEPNAPAGATFADMAEKWKLSMPVVIDKEALGRDVLGVVEAPTIVVFDRQHRLQFFQERAHPLLPQALPELLRRLVDGESLADTMNDKAKTEDERFVAQLWLARASDGAATAFTQPKPYPPQQVRLAEQSRKASPQSILAMTADAQHNVWTLRADGELECIDSLGQTQASYSTDWVFALPSGSSASAEPIRLAIDASAKHVAVRGASATELRILDTTSRKTSIIKLGSGQTVTDYRWLASPQSSRLAAISEAGRTVLIDPERDQQLSGQSPARPVALLQRAADDVLASGYVILIDGRIEPVILEEQAGAKRAALVKPVSTGKSTEINPVVQRQLKFTPAAGPWSIWEGNQTSATLARGMVAPDEPAVFMLDHQLRQVWHAPLPIADAPDSFFASVAHDPVSGQPLWVVVQPKQTLHFFRADGNLVDHCQLADPIRGLALVPSGDELHLWIAHPQSLVHYRLF